MDITLKVIEEMKLSNTEERIINYLSSISDNNSTITEISNHIKGIYATFCKELKKLVSKGIVIINGLKVSLSDFGLKLCNYNKFKTNIINQFCNSNKIDNDTYNFFISNKNYSNMKLLIGIKNLLNK